MKDNKILYYAKLLRNAFRLKAYLSAFLTVPELEDCRNLPGHPARFEFLGVIHILERLICQVSNRLGSLSFDDLPAD